MSLKKQSFIPSEKRRTSRNTSIHNIFIFKSSGICIYGKNFTRQYNMEDNLISAFFTALRSFTKEVVGEKIKTVEMGKVKFVIIKKHEYFYGFLSNNYENIVVLQEIANKIHTKYLKYIKKHGNSEHVEQIQNKSFEKEVGAIITEIVGKEYDLKKEHKIIEFLQEYSQSGDLEGVVLLTQHSKVIFSSMGDMELNNLLKEMNFRLKASNNSILKMYYTSKTGKIVFSEQVEDLYYIVLVLNPIIKFGIAEYYLQKAVNFIRTFLSKY